MDIQDIMGKPIEELIGEDEFNPINPGADLLQEFREIDEETPDQMLARVSGQEATEDDEAGKEAAASGADEGAGATVEPPTTLKVGDIDVPVTDLTTVWTESQELKHLLEEAGVKAPLGEIAQNGIQFMGMQEQFGAGVKEARTVVAEVYALFLQDYGPKIPDGEAIELALDSLDWATMTPTERGLYCAFAAMKTEAARAAQELVTVTTEAKKLNEKATETTTARQEVDLIKAKYPDAAVTTDDVIRYKKDTGIKDPVRAFESANLDSLLAKAREDGLSEGAKKRPEFPAGAEAPDIDPANMTVGQIQQKLGQHFAPKGKA